MSTATSAVERPQSLDSPRSNGSSRITSVGPYQFIKTLGRGVFGKVKLAMHASTREKVAVKIIEKEKLDANTLKMVRREVMIMKLLDHPNIIKLHEVLEGPDHVFIVMEYAPGGEMIDFVIAHDRDLKPENLLLDSDFHIKIIDFGLSNVYVPGQFLRTFCGSPTYSAPELIEQQHYQGPKIDIWSLGVVLFVMVCGYLPFDGTTFAELFGRIVKGEYVLPDHISEECRDLIAKMLLVNPAKRCSIDDVRVHPWVLQNGEPVPKADIPSYIGAVQLDAELLEEMARMGFDPELVASSVRSQQFDDNAATYYLLCARKQRELSVIEEESDDGSNSSAASTSSSSSSSKKSARPVKHRNLVKHEESHQRKVRTWDEKNLNKAPGESPQLKVPPSSSTLESSQVSKVKRSISPPSKSAPQSPVTQEELPVPAVTTTLASSFMVQVSPRKPHRHKGDGATEGSKSLKRESSSGEKTISIKHDVDRKPSKVARPKASKTTVVRPQSRHTLHLPKAEKQSSGRKTGEGEDIVIPLSRSPIRPGSLTPKSARARTPEKSSKSRSPDRPDSPLFDQPEEEEEEENARAVNELIQSFQTTFKITTKNSKPASPGAPVPRKERFPVNANTTTEQSPEVVLAKLKDVLLEKEVEFGFSSPFCLLCQRATIGFELEICSIPNLEVNGIRFHRISGDVWEYSKLCKSILTDMNLGEE